MIVQSLEQRKCRSLSPGGLLCLLKHLLDVTVLREGRLRRFISCSDTLFCCLIFAVIMMSKIMIIFLVCLRERRDVILLRLFFLLTRLWFICRTLYHLLLCWTERKREIEMKSLMKRFCYPQLGDELCRCSLNSSKRWWQGMVPEGVLISWLTITDQYLLQSSWLEAKLLHQELLQQICEEDSRDHSCSVLLHCSRMTWSFSCLSSFDLSFWSLLSWSWWWENFVVFKVFGILHVFTSVVEE